MKNLSLIILSGLLLVVLFTGCEEQEDVPAYEVAGATVAVANQTGFFDLGDLTNTFSFDVASRGEDVSSLDIYKSYNGGAPVFHSTVNTIPSTITITPAQAVDGLGVTTNDLAIGDFVTFSFDNVQTASGSYPSGTSTSASVACLSALAGTHSAVTTTAVWCTETATKDVVWTEEAPGVYSIDDFAFGTYDPCYGISDTPDGDLRVMDVCNEITLSGSSQWGELYTWSISNINGTEMTITWENDYGENGVTVLTNGNGDNWPPLYTP